MAGLAADQRLPHSRRGADTLSRCRMGELPSPACATASFPVSGRASGHSDRRVRSRRRRAACHRSSGTIRSSGASSRIHSAGPSRVLLDAPPIALPQAVPDDLAAVEGSEQDLADGGRRPARGLPRWGDAVLVRARRRGRGRGHRRGGREPRALEGGADEASPRRPAYAYRTLTCERSRRSCGIGHPLYLGIPTVIRSDVSTSRRRIRGSSGFAMIPYS